MLPLFISLLSTALQEPKPVEVIDITAEGYWSTLPNAVSDKGDVAIGRAILEPNYIRETPWIWTKQRGITLIKDKPGQIYHGTLTGDGRFFAGYYSNPPKGPWVYYGLSTNPTSRVLIANELNGGIANGSDRSLWFSNDGRYLLGSNSRKRDHLQIHDMKANADFLLPNPTAGVGKSIRGFSADGSRALFFDGDSRHYIWDKKRPTVFRQIRIPMLDARKKYQIVGLSDDGKVAVGNTSFDDGRHVFKWSEDKGIEPGPFPTNYRDLTAYVINGDGSIVGGLMPGEDGAIQVGIWFDKFKAFRTLKSMLKPTELPHPKLVFSSITDINPEGTVFLVSGFIPEQGKWWTTHTYIVKFASKQVMEGR